ncbi:MAG: glutathionylspermidine synthase family protein [Chloroherpetonaceae bacterium]|nr:glutathionylspermidine synthase family protein [Chloroherpetonaceae bacterium]
MAKLQQGNFRIRETAYLDFATQILQNGIINDPWLYGEERFLLDAIILTKHELKSLFEAAESIGSLYHEFTEIILKNPHFLESYFALTPFQKLMWFSSRGEWHAISRLDLFLCQNGQIRCCEMNSDTPSGEAETVLLNELLLHAFPSFENPNADFKSRFLRLVERVSEADVSTPKTIGIIYPTEHTEDLSMILSYEKWLSENGFKVLLGSPYNLSCDKNLNLLLFDTKLDLILRHYKTDWWGERIPIWKDSEDFADPDPLENPLLSIIKAETAGKVKVLNPFGAILTQNKLSMAFFFDFIHLFSSQSQKTIHDFFPLTRSLRVEDLSNYLSEKNDWVLKSVYGCEGAEVIIGKNVTDEIWQETLEKLIPRYWIAQKFFESSTIHSQYPVANFGVYLCGGISSGIFTRLSPSSTDFSAKTAPTYIEKN